MHWLRPFDHTTRVNDKSQTWGEEKSNTEADITKAKADEAGTVAKWGTAEADLEALEIPSNHRGIIMEEKKKKWSSKRNEGL